MDVDISNRISQCYDGASDGLRKKIWHGFEYLYLW